VRILTPYAILDRAGNPAQVDTRLTEQSLGQPAQGDTQSMFLSRLGACTRGEASSGNMIFEPRLKRTGPT
jgi:hypothetical protein